MWRESLIHERIFGGYVLLTLFRLWFAVGFFSFQTLFYIASLLLIVSGVLLTRGAESRAEWAWRARLAIYPALMCALFVDMRATSPLINGGKMDALLWAADESLVGGSLSVMLQPLISPALTDLSSFFYMFFIVWLFVSMLGWLVAGGPAARVFYAGLFGLYGIGYFGYTLVPAVGPYIAYASEFSVPLEGGFLTDFLAVVYPSGTNYTDVFPSLHCAVSVYLLFFEMNRSPARFRLCLVPCVGICFSTIYLRYHYFADVLAGLAAAALAMWMVRLAEAGEKRRCGS